MLLLFVTPSFKTFRTLVFVSLNSKPEGLEISYVGNKAGYFPHKFCGPRGFHTNAGLKVKSKTRFRKMFHSKTKKPLDSIRRQNRGAHLKVSLFLPEEG